ncbi:MAG: hypothetical protein SFW35_04905 [Chitinophagales bacterium]|nr:hypothetical protein [Chitinophagales bacterium]
MKMIRTLLLINALVSVSWAHGSEQHATCPSDTGRTDSALSTVLRPVFGPEYYVEQGVKYFLTMQSDVPLRVVPRYSRRVIRWEWPPWLLLTGYTRKNLYATDAVLKLTPTSYDAMDCRYFDQQPFCRCHVVFNYSGQQCPIYEEFTFNDQGEITFIEAWSDYESLLPMGPGADSTWSAADYWAQNGAKRLSTKLPGLGSKHGRIKPNAGFMKRAAELDNDIAELLTRLQRPAYFWLQRLWNTYNEVKNGCEPPKQISIPITRVRANSNSQIGKGMG